MLNLNSQNVSVRLIAVIEDNIQQPFIIVNFHVL